ncbi:unnamed protein product [Pleuronectes platessa]|uniref:Uncharacterized protein n=1 Tax=Pleuronectes platessa TaxID=8262 RepID=A0A9N7U395_PLEPL|nr:unnamed protein product [Pleuronectes platessa]
MNGGDFERLISPSQSVWSWRRLQRPREKSVASEILAAIPQAALETVLLKLLQRVHILNLEIPESAEQQQ